MKWIRISIDTTTAAVDFISEMLSELGVEGIEIEDLVANPIILWEIENEPSIELIKNKIRKIKR